MTKLVKPRSTKSLATMCARLAQEKLAQNIIIMNLTKIDFAPADYFVICTCDTDLQSRAVNDLILTQVKDFKLQTPNIEGLDSTTWIILDFFDVVVHVMLPEARSFYQLEKLWGDAKFHTLDEDGKVISFDRKSLNYGV